MGFLQTPFQIRTNISTCMCTTNTSLDIDPMLFHVIKPSVYRRLFDATEVFDLIRQSYVREEEKHVKFCRDEVVEEISSHLPSIPYG